MKISQRCSPSRFLYFYACFAAPLLLIIFLLSKLGSVWLTSALIYALVIIPFLSCFVSVLTVRIKEVDHFLVKEYLLFSRFALYRKYWKGPFHLHVLSKDSSVISSFFVGVVGHKRKLVITVDGVENDFSNPFDWMFCSRIFTKCE